MKGKNYTQGASGGMVYATGLFGALYYYISTATSLADGLLGVVQALFWPGFLVYELLVHVAA